MIKRLTKREQKIFIVTLVLILGYIGNNLLVKPLKEKILSLDQAIVAEEIRLKKNQRIIGQAKALSEDYNAYLNNFKQSKTNEQVMSSILSEIEEVAGELELRISDLKPKRVKRGEYYNRFSVSLTIDSDFVDIIHFLYILQKQPHLFDVEEVRFDKGSRRRSSTMKTQLVLGKMLIP